MRSRQVVASQAVDPDTITGEEWSAALFFMRKAADEGHTRTLAEAVRIARRFAALGMPTDALLDCLRAEAERAETDAEDAWTAALLA
jgi:hypothetical protein